MSKNIRKGFLNAIRGSFEAYKEFGARSNKKLIPIHSWLAKQIVSGLQGGYEAKSLGLGGELELEGKYYPKILDITILKENKPIVVISFKFVTSNYAQNSINYFENLLGETANIRRAGLGFAHFLVLRGHTPYYSKTGDLKKTEILSEHHIEKYVKLFKDYDFPHKPEVLGMAIVDFDGDKPFYKFKETEIKTRNYKDITD